MWDWSKAQKLFFSGIVFGILFFLFSFTVFVQAAEEDLSVDATVPAICGNGFEEGAETCDDGNLVSGDGCSNLCADEEEEEDESQNNGSSGDGGNPPAPAVVCGNGIKQGAEGCDDGNVVSGDGCSNICAVEPAPVCRNGVKEGLEQCDDGNAINGDGCSNQCLFEPVCGNGLVEAAEQCDDSNVVSGDGCSNVCQNEAPGAVCGNHIVEDAEMCDDGNILNNDGCSNACRVELPLCGNGVRQGAETCDDGNVANGDGCSALCQVEVGLCGNSVREFAEQCDDGNLANGDGCSNVCHNEPAPICGNGIREQAEQCDDGNRIAGDGCSLFCRVERAEENGDDPVVNGEDGNPENNGQDNADGANEDNPDGANEDSGDGENNEGNADNGNGPNGENGENAAGPDGENGGDNNGENGEGNGNGNGNGDAQAGKDGDRGANGAQRGEAAVEVPESIFSGVNKDASATEKVVVVASNIQKIVTAEAQQLKLTLINASQKVSETVQEAAQTVNEIADNPKVEEITETVVAPATVGVAAAAVVPSLWSIVFPLLKFAFLQPLLLFGRKKRREWGQIYNSLTKLPVDLAMVRLVDAKTKRVLQSRVTDMQGRYLFIAEEGDYLLEVAKPGFSFPSNLLKTEKTDGKLIDLYHGEVVSVKGTGISLTPNIPLDPAGAEKTPHRIKWEKYGHLLQHMVSTAGVVITAISLYISPIWYLWVMLAAHVVMYILFIKFVKPKKPKGWGIVYEKDSVVPVGNTVVRLFTKKYNKLVSTQVTDKKGRYAFLVGPSEYYVTFDKKGYKSEKSNDITIPEQETAAILKEDVKLEKQV